MAKKYVPVTSFEEALAADASGVLYVANFSKKELEEVENHEQEWLPTTQPWLQDAYNSHGLMPEWQFRFPGWGKSSHPWPLEDFAILTDDEEE